jgi:tripartite-type tricarboxylate transporter receptor subunit TctC
VQSGGVRALAVTTTTRSPSQPNLPTIAESGLPGYDANTWGGILAPAGTPKDVVARLNAEINKALALPDVAQQLATEGATPVPGTPQAFGDLIRREIPRWAEVVKAGNVKPE